MTETQVKSQVMRVYDIFTKHLFEVPWHQRYYDWEIEHVEELLDDLKDACERERASYFLGSIMLVERESEARHEINDGQQRLITVLLLVAVFARRFESPNQADPVRENLAVRLLFDRAENESSKLSDSSKYDPRLLPPRNDKCDFFQLIRGQDVGTQSKLILAWKTINTFIAGMDEKSGIGLFDFLHRKVEIAVLFVPQDANANAVFEALNCRGKRLEDLDLMRNHLYSYFSHPSESSRRDTVHDSLERARATLGVKAEEYFRCFFECEFGFIPQKRFYRETKSKLRTLFQSRGIDGLHQLVRQLCAGENIELFRTINAKNPSHDLLASFLPLMGQKRRKFEILLRELQGYRVAHPLTFALLRRYIQEEERQTKREIGKICFQSLSDLASLIIRTVLVTSKFESSRVESNLANCAHEVSGGYGLQSLRIQSSLKNMDTLGIIKDNKFIENMINIDFRNSAKARLYLFGIVEQNQVGAEVLQSEKLTLEHILPTAPTHWNGWSGFKSCHPEDWIYKAGNLALLTSGENRPDGKFNSSFSEKRKILKKSTIEITAEVGSKWKQWNPGAIQNRSKALAQQAASVWRFSRGVNL